MTKRLRLLLCAVATTVLCACTPAQVSLFLSLEREERDPLIEHVIRSAAEEFGVPGDLLMAIARCESGLRPDAKSRQSTASGLFQYLDFTWERARTRLYERGIDTEPYGPQDVWNPIATSRVTANVVAEGGLSWWAESAHCWGSVAVRTGMR